MRLKSSLFSVAVCITPLLLAGQGIAGSGKAALTRADISCGDYSGIYTDCGNGTVTDNRSGLTWLKNVGCLNGTGPTSPSLANLTWDRATIEAHNLSDGVCGLTDGSTPGDWRLPTLDELRRMIADGKAMGCTGPVLTNAKGDKCHDVDPIFYNFCGPVFDNGAVYWTATSDTGTGFNTDAFVVDLYDGLEGTDFKPHQHCVWPVRLTQGPGG